MSHGAACLAMLQKVDSFTFLAACNVTIYCVFVGCQSEWGVTLAIFWQLAIQTAHKSSKFP